MSLSNNQMAQIANKLYDVLPDEMSNLELSLIITSLLLQYDSENDWDDVTIAVSGMLEILKSIPPSLKVEGADIKDFMFYINKSKAVVKMLGEDCARDDADEFMKKITNH